MDKRLYYLFQLAKLTNPHKSKQSYFLLFSLITIANQQQLANTNYNKATVLETTVLTRTIIIKRPLRLNI